MPPTRRTALLAALAAIAGGGAGPADRPMPPQAPATPMSGPQPPALTTTEQMSHATLRLAVTGASGTRTVATGFLFSLFKAGDDHVPVLVTSRHALGDAASLSFQLNGIREDGAPDYRNTIPVTVGQVPPLRLDHPDPAVDLAILAFNPLLQQVKAAGRSPFVRFLAPDLIPTDDALWSLTPVEDVLTIGFLEGLRDGAPAIPVFRRGITATPAYLAFDGQRQFLIDAPVWPGQEGAPVLLYESSYSDDTGRGLVVGTRISLLGVLAGTRMQAADGTLVPLAAQAKPAPGTTPGVPSTLGLCIAAARVLEFEPLLARMGRPVPPGYRMRAAPA